MAEAKRPILLEGKVGARPPFKVNEWHNPENDVTTSVWWNGCDGYNIYWNDELLDTLYVNVLPSNPDFPKVHGVAVSSACEIGYQNAYGKPFSKEK